MLPKANRLTKKNDFDLVFKNGKTIKGDFLIVKILKNQLEESRFGFVVSKKVSNKATVRNKVKRRLRDAVARELENIPKSMDVVMVTLKGLEKKDFLEIQEIIKGLIKKI